MTIKKFEEISSVRELNEQRELREKKYKNLYYFAWIVGLLTVLLFFLPIQNNTYSKIIEQFMNPIGFSMLIGSISFNLFMYHRFLTLSLGSLKQFGVLNILILIFGNYVFLGHAFGIFP
tara:strand:- start:530 stop:886 length:357 start_codon:yes stop_codon:yes gene_type:complete